MAVPSGHSIGKGIDAKTFKAGNSIRFAVSDFEPRHQGLQLLGQAGGLLATGQNLDRHHSYLRRLLIDIVDVAGDIGNYRRGLGNVFIDLGDPLGRLSDVAHDPRASASTIR